MKPYLTLLILLLFCYSSGFAQLSPTAIEGSVLDSSSSHPLSYVTVSAKSTKSGSTKVVFSNEKGSFIFKDLLPGEYLISFSIVGYNSQRLVINLKDSIHLKNTLLDRKLNTLNDIKITGTRPVVKQEIDRLSYDVQADPTNKGLNILEVFQKIPLISVDGEDNIQLKGSSDFKIYVNNRPSGVMTSNPSQALRIMRSKNVKKIEVISTPSAKYDSEGVAGIINIITETNVQGYNAVFELFHTSKLGAYGTGTMITVKKGRLGISGYAGQYLRRNVPEASFSNERTNLLNNTYESNTGISRMNGTHTPLNGDLSIEMDSLNLFTASFVSSFNNLNYRDSQISSTTQDASSIFYYSAIQSHPKTGWLDINANFQHGFKNKKDRLLTLSYKYGNTVNDLQSFNAVSGQYNYSNEQINDAGLNEHTAQLDFSDPGKMLSKEAGGKVILRSNFSDFTSIRTSDGIQNTKSDSFKYGQDIYVLYNSYQLKLRRFGASAGLRYEGTVLNSLNRNYNNLVPSVQLLFKFKDSKNINLGYTQRIQRPGILQLNPFENQSNPLYYTSGNPNLKAVINNSFEANFSSLKKTTLTIGVNYVFANNAIQNILQTTDDGITRSSFANSGKNYNLGTNISLNHPFSRRLRYVFNGRGQYLGLSGTLSGRQYNTEGFQYTTSHNISFSSSKDWRVRMLLTSTSKQINLQGKTNAYVYSVFTVNKEFFNKKLGVIFRIDNPTGKNRTIVSQFLTPDFKQENRSDKLARGFYINLYYTIGELKEKIKKNKRGVENNDVEKGKSELN